MTDWFDEPCKEPDGAAASAAAERQLALTKPPGSLGRVESLAVELAGWQRTDRPRADRVHIAVFAGDHGIAADGVSAYPQAVTGEMLRNFATGGAAIAVLARQLGATLEVIDLGTVNAPGHVDGVRHERIAASTSNIRHGAAMTAPQLRAALEAGRRSVHRAVGNAAHVFIGGDMGIGNTAVASALACALLGEEPHVLTGGRHRP
jgi:nicotinate-nucleotide--dimethylbenzimidazole phosphoribosyltransferase